MKSAKRLIAVVLPLAMVVAACGGDDDDEGSGGSSSAENPPAAGSSEPVGELTLAPTFPPTNLDPHKAGSIVGDSQFINPVYDRLTQVVAGADGAEVAPMLATEWAYSEDGLTLTFTLRDDVTFHDGTPLDAEAVRLSLERARTDGTAPVTAKYEPVESIEAPDATTVVLHLNRPTTELPTSLATIAGAVVNPASLDSPTLDREPDGSGPYVVTDLSIGDRITYEAAPEYWDDSVPRAQSIELVGMGDDNARLNALQSGQVDGIVVKLGQYAQAKELADQGDFTMYTYPPSSSYPVQLNIGRPIMEDEKVRQALNYAIDRDAINESLLGGQCDATSQLVQEGFAGHVADLEGYEYDPDKARELLAEAGYEDGFPMKIVVGAGLTPQNQIATAVQDQLGEVGIDVKVDSLDNAASYTAWTEGQYDGYVAARSAAPDGPSTLAENYLNPALFPGGAPEEFKAELDQAFDPSLGEDERQEHAEAANTMASESAFDIYICTYPVVYMYDDDVVGLDNTGLAYVYNFIDLRGVAGRAG